MRTGQERFEAAIAAFDAANAEDPNRDEGQPKELLYSSTAEKEQTLKN